MPVQRKDGSLSCATMDDYEIDLSHKDCVLNKSVLADGILTRTLSEDLIAFKS